MILAWADFINLIRAPPHSLWFIMLVCLLVSLFSTFLNKILIDHEKSARIQAVITEHNKRKKELLKMSEENPKKYAKEYAKWQRRDASVQKMQQKSTLERLKPTCITFLPLMGFFFLIRSIYTPVGSVIQLPVARPPMNPMQEFPAFITTILQSQMFTAFGNITIDMGFIGYTGWYMLCSFALSTLIQRILGIAKTAQGPQGGSIFDSASSTQLPKPSEL